MVTQVDRCIWNGSTSYAIGLLVADGSLSKDGRHIDFTSKDEDLIRLFQTCLRLSHCKIGLKASGTNKQKKYFRIQFSDRQFHSWLQTIGVHPNKSTSIEKVGIPSEYFIDFLRGVFDGDGTIYMTKDKRWKNSYTIALGFASGSKPFLTWIKQELEQQLCTTGFITTGARVMQLRFGKADATLITKAMYANKDTPRLQRKFAKVTKILRIDEPQRE